MKIRQGFVSNSSSSSFIVAFSKEPTSIEEVKKEVFKEVEYVGHSYDNFTVFSAFDLAKIIFEDIQKQKPNVEEEIVDSVEGGWFKGHAEFSSFELPNGKFDWVGYEKANKEAARKITDKFIEENKDKFIYVFSFSDNDPNPYSTLEHGEIFRNLNHIQTSYH
jgi:hypothetical protein